MKGAMVIAGREVRGYFDSPVAYVFIAAFLLLAGVPFFFLEGFFAANAASLRGYFGLMPLILSLLVPALTMRLWAEEKKQGTYESLVTLPMAEYELVAGKYLASMAVIGAAFAASLPVPLMVSIFGRFDAGQIATEYVGALLLASMAAALGQALSAAADNQMSAFVAAALCLLALTLLPEAAVWLDLPSWLSSAFDWVSPSYHFSSFAKGILDTRDLLYFVLGTGLCLYLTSSGLRAAKWK